MQKKSAAITIIYIALGAVWLSLGSHWVERLDERTPGEDMSFLLDYKNIIRRLFYWTKLGRQKRW